MSAAQQRNAELVQILAADFIRRTADGVEVPAGTWTPTFAGSGTPGTFTYTNQYGYYTKVGKLVSIIGRVGISAIAVAPTGVMIITGLPFTNANITDNIGSVCFGIISNLDYAPGVIQVTGAINVNSSAIALDTVFDNGGAGNYAAANFTNAACYLVFAGQYRAA